MPPMRALARLIGCRARRVRAVASCGPVIAAELEMARHGLRLLPRVTVSITAEADGRALRAWTRCR